MVVSPVSFAAIEAPSGNLAGKLFHFNHYTIFRRFVKPSKKTARAGRFRRLVFSAGKDFAGFAVQKQRDRFSVGVHNPDVIVIGVPSQ